MSERTSTHQYDSLCDVFFCFSSLLLGMEVCNFFSELFHLSYQMMNIPVLVPQNQEGEEVNLIFWPSKEH